MNKQQKLLTFIPANLAMVLLAICAPALAATPNIIWQNLNGPHGGYVDTILVTDTAIFAGAKNGVFTSTDHGKNWSVSLPGYDIIKLVKDYSNNIYAGTNGNGVLVLNNNTQKWLPPDPSSPIAHTIVNDILISRDNTIYAGTDNGAFYSQHQGTGWRKSPSAIPDNAKIKALTLDSANNAYATSFIFPGQWDVYQTTNHGQTWESKSLSSDFYPMTGFITDTKNNLYLGGINGQVYYYDSISWNMISFPAQGYTAQLKVDHNTLFAGFYSGELFFCGDNCSDAHAWTELSRVNSPLLDLLITHQDNKTTMYTATENGVYASSDMGKNWLNPTQTFPLQLTLTLANDINNIYAGLAIDGIALSDRASKNSWVLPQTNLEAIKPLFKPVAHDASIYFPTEYGLYSFADSDKKWKLNSEYNALTDLTMDDSGTVYLNNDLKLFFSADHGKTWAQAPLTNSTCVATKNNIAYACQDPDWDTVEVWSTSDHGKKWTTQGSPEPGFRTTLLTVDNKNTIFAGGFSPRDKTSKIYSKQNNWQLVCATEGDETFTQLSVDNNNHYIYATSMPSGTNTPTKIYRYDTTQCKAIYSASTIGHMVIDSSNDDIYMLATINSSTSNHAGARNPGLYISHDFGASWQAVPQFDDQQLNDIVIDAATNTIYVGTFANGVYLSQDHGKNWVQANTNLNPLAIEFLTLDSQHTIYAVTFGGGVFKSNP